MINLEDILILKKGGIHIKKKNRGKFTEYCGGKVTQECIAKGKNSKDPKIRKRATFAANARKWKHENGGILKAQEGTTISPERIPTLEEYIQMKQQEARQTALANSYNATKPRLAKRYYTEKDLKDLRYDIMRTENKVKKYSKSAEKIEKKLNHPFAPKHVFIFNPIYKDVSSNTGLSDLGEEMLNELNSNRIAATSYENDIKEYQDRLDYINEHGYDWTGYNCITTATGWYGDPYVCAGNIDFKENPSKYGFVEINAKDALPGDIFQYDSGGSPYHATMYSKKGDYSYEYYTNYSNGNYRDAIRHDSDYYRRGDRAFRFVGLPEDIEAWTQEYNELYSKKFGGVLNKFKKGGILKAQNGTSYGLPGGIPIYMQSKPLSPIDVAIKIAQSKARLNQQTPLPPGVKEVIGPDGKKVVIRTEQPLQPLEQNIAEWLPGTGDVAELGYIANDVKNSNLGSAALATGMIVLPGNIGKLFGKRKSRKIGKLDRDIPKGRRPEKVSKKVNLNENELSDGDIYFNGTSTAEDALQRQKLGESVIDDLVRGRTDSYSFDELPDDFLGEETPFKYLEPRKINYTFKDPSIFEARLDPEVSKPFLYYTKKGNIYRSKSPKIGSRQFDTFIQKNKWNDELPGLRIFDQYKSAMTRRRNYTWSGLIDQYNSGNAYGIEDMNGNALMGYPLFGKGLIASHFAPRTMRGGANLISRLNDNPYPVVFSVTEDLSPMLSKIGYKKLSKSIPQSFNGDIVQKQVFINRGFDPNLFLKKLGIKAKSTNFIEDIMSGEFTPETVEVIKPIILYKRGGIL